MSRLAEMGLVGLGGCRDGRLADHSVASDGSSTGGGQRVRDNSGQGSEVVPYLVVINVAFTGNGDLGGDIELQTSNDLRETTTKLN